jgi:hypothetical protein
MRIVKEWRRRGKGRRSAVVRDLPQIFIDERGKIAGHGDKALLVVGVVLQLSQFLRLAGLR